MTQYDPAEIAAQLVQEHGLEEAIDMATEGILSSQQTDDFYALSIWREVRRHLRSRQPREDRRPH